MPSKINTALHVSELVSEFDIKGMMANLQLDETVVPVCIIADTRQPQINEGTYQRIVRATGQAGERSMAGFTNASTGFRTQPAPAVRIVGAWVESELAGELAISATDVSFSLNNSTSVRGVAVDPLRVGPTALVASGSVLTAGTRATAAPGTRLATRTVAAGEAIELTELVGLELAATVAGQATAGVIVQVAVDDSNLDLTLRWEEFTP